MKMKQTQPDNQDSAHQSEVQETAIKGVPVLSQFEQKILELWNENLSASVIAAELKVTKNMICGQVYRMRARGVDIQKRTFGNVGTAYKKREPRTAREAPLLDWMFKQPKKESKPLPERPKATEARPLNIRFKQLNNNSCRYVVNEGRPENFIFCGAPKERGAYCGAHAAICYVAPTYDQKRNIKRMVRFA